MNKSFEHMATRLNNAENSFSDYVVSKIGCTTEEAFKVLATFRKIKVIKLDAVMGTYHVKHGAFLNADVLRRALAS